MTAHSIGPTSYEQSLCVHVPYPMSMTIHVRNNNEVPCLEEGRVWAATFAVGNFRGPLLGAPSL